MIFSAQWGGNDKTKVFESSRIKQGAGFLRIFTVAFDRFV